MVASTSAFNICLAQLSAVHGSILLTGFLGSFSYFGVPTVAIAPADVALKQYQKMGGIGFSTAFKLAIGTASIYTWLAYTAFRVGARDSGRTYCVAAISSPMIILYTILFMTPTNARLNAIASAAQDRKSKINSAEVRALLWRWKGLNYIRTTIALIASVSGLVGTMGRIL